MEVNSHQRISQLLEGYDGTAERLDKILHEYGRVGDKTARSKVFFMCCEIGDEQLLLSLLSKEVDVYSIDGVGNTAMHCAARFGFKRFARQLFGRGARINARNKDNIRPIDLASNDEVKEFIEDASKASSLRFKMLMNAIEESDVEGLIALGSGDGCLSLKDVRMVQEDNNDPANYSKTLLHVAVQMDDLSTTSALLDAGADVHAKDIDGWTPLHYVARYNRAKEVAPQIMGLLVRAGARLEEEDNFGMTPLHGAACEGNSATVAALLHFGTDVNVRDKSGMTPLHYASHYGEAGVIPVLLQGGADVYALDQAGCNPYDVANTPNGDMVRALLEREMWEQEARRAKLKNATGAAADDDTEECSEVDDGKRDDKEPQSKVARL